jgi:hypothetical protein
MWSSVLLATDNSGSTKKRFLSRTARYSGLLNVLDFATVSSFEDTSLELVSTLVDANSWIAFNVSQSAIPALSQAALNAGMYIIYVYLIIYICVYSYTYVYVFMVIFICMFVSGIKRVIFTTELPPHRINETTIPEFTAATVAFEAVGAAFTGIRHATVIEGHEVCLIYICIYICISICREEYIQTHLHTFVYMTICLPNYIMKRILT